MNESFEPIEEKKSLSKKVWMSAALGLLLLFGTAGLAAYAWKMIPKSGPQPGPINEPILATDDGNTVQLPLAPLPQVPFIDTTLHQKAAVAQAKLTSLRNTAQQTRVKLETLAQSNGQLQRRFQSLLHDQHGRKIAAKQQYLEQFSALQQQFETTPLDAASLQDELEILIEPTNTSGATTVDESYLIGVQDLAQRVENMEYNLKMFRRSLDALQNASSAQPPAPETLEVTLDMRAQKMAAEQLAILAERETEIREEEFRNSLQQSADNARRMAQQENALRHLREQQRLDEAKAANKAQEDQLAQANLEREFERDQPEVQSLLRPFLAAGMTQPGRHQFETAAEEGPVSYGRILGAGFLEPTVSARNNLYYVVGSTNDRELGAFPRYVGGAQNVQKVQKTMNRVQELLIKYGEMMVEKKLLAP